MKAVQYIAAFFTILFFACRTNTDPRPASGVNDTIPLVKNIDVPQITSQEEQSEVQLREQALSDFQKATLYGLKDTIKADFNGDGFQDFAVYIKDSLTSGILIRHGQTDEEFRLGFGQSIGGMTEFDWVDYWGLVEDKETSENIFSEDGDLLESRTVKLQNPSIALGKLETGGGLITFRNGRYKWIHQTC